MKKPQKKYCCLLLACVVAAVTYAQDPQFASFTTRQGMSTYNTRKILQDKFGFLWIVTQDGMNRFDGLKFSIINKTTSAENSLGGTYVTDCDLDDAGDIWVGTEYGGVDVIDPADFKITSHIRTSPNGLISNWVRTICAAGKNEIWIGTYYGLSIFDKATKTFHNITTNDLSRAEPLNINCIKKDSESNIWLAVENQGLLVMNQSRQVIAGFDKTFFGMSSDAALKITDIYTDKKGLVFVSANVGLIIFDCNDSKHIRQVHLPLLSMFEHMEVHSCIQDKKGIYWVGTSKGLYLVSDHIFLAKHDPLKDNTILDDYINNIFEDSFGNMWVTSTKGLNLLLNVPYYFKSYSYDNASNTPFKHCYSIAPFSDSVMLASTIGGLYLTNINTSVSKKIIDINQLGIIDAIYRLDARQFIVSGEKKTALLTIDPTPALTDLGTLYPELKLLEERYFSKIIDVSDSVLLFGSRDESGLFTWNKELHTVHNYIRKDFSDSSGIFDNYIQNIKKDKDNKIWLLSDMSLSNFDLSQQSFQHHYPVPGKKGSINSYFLMDLYDDGSNYWLTSYGGGVNIVNKKSFHTTSITIENGLPANTTYAIIPDGDSAVWVSTNNGLARINTHTFKVEKYTYESGMQLNAFEIRSSAKVNNAIYFGGIDGFIRVVGNERYHPIQTFPVYISGFSYKINNTAFQYSELKQHEKYVLPPQPDQLNFYIAALGYSQVYKYLYQYRLVEHNSKWIDLGNNNRISFSALPHGTYHLQVRVSASDQIWNVSDTIVFTILPKWYQTWWFKILVLLTAAGIIYAFYRYRIGQIKKQHQIRKNIATDLHDDLGSTLNSVKVFTNLAISGVNQNESLQQIKDNLNEATIGLRDMIWVLDDSLDTVDELVIRLKQFALPVATASNIEAVIKADSEVNNIRLTKEEKRNLFLVCKEVINNSIKYAEASRIDVSIFPSGKKIKIIISDNGKGFDAALVKKGYGLKNMQYRAGQVKYKVNIHSLAGSGTTVEIIPV